MKTHRFVQNNVWVLNKCALLQQCTTHTRSNTTSQRAHYRNKSVAFHETFHVGQQMSGRDLRMLLSGLEVKGPLLVFVYVTLNKKQT